jgi:hypothetical protein
MPGNAHTAPAGHAVGATLPLGQNVPGVQSPLTAVRPLDAQYVPAGHTGGAARPVAAHSAPAAHTVGAAPAPAQKLPAVHAVSTPPVHT